jgi:hypothetical protein
LQAARAAGPGEIITAAGQVLARAATTSTTSGVWAEDLTTGKRRNLTTEEDRAFWAWAAIEVLRATGVFSRGLLSVAWCCVNESFLWILRRVSQGVGYVADSSYSCSTG